MPSIITRISAVKFGLIVAGAFDPKTFFISYNEAQLLVLSSILQQSYDYVAIDISVAYFKKIINE